MNIRIGLIGIMCLVLFGTALGQPMPASSMADQPLGSVSDRSAQFATANMTLSEDESIASGSVTGTPGRQIAATRADDLSAAGEFSGRLRPSDVSLSQAIAEPGTEIRPIRNEVLSSSALVREFSNLKRTDQAMMISSEFLQNQGFVAQTSPENYLGLRETYEIKSISTGEITRETYSLLMQDYLNPSTSDIAAIARITVEAGDQSEEYTFDLIAPEGDFENAIEYRVAKLSGVQRVVEAPDVVGRFDTGMDTGMEMGIDSGILSETSPSLTRGDLQMVRANSWWSCVKSKIRQKCASRCINALVTCDGGSWTAYIGCVAWRCGGCFVKYSVCCACDCRWWCRWAVGCCDR